MEEDDEDEDDNNIVEETHEGDNENVEDSPDLG